MSRIKASSVKRKEARKKTTSIGGNKPHVNFKKRKCRRTRKAKRGQG